MSKRLNLVARPNILESTFTSALDKIMVANIHMVCTTVPKRQKKVPSVLKEATIDTNSLMKLIFLPNFDSKVLYKS